MDAIGYLTHFFAVLVLVAVSPSLAQYVRFSPASDLALCITVTGNSNSDSAPLSTAPCSYPTGLYQKFTRTATKSVGSLLTIATGQSAPCAQKCVDLSGNDVVQNDCNPGAMTQYWTQSPNPPPGSMTGFNSYTNFKVGPTNCMTDLGTNVGLSICNSELANQLWHVGTPVPNVGGSTIMNQQWFRCLQVSGGSNQNGASLLDAGCSSSAFYQRFNILDVSALVAKYTIAGSGKCMDGGILSSPQPTYQYTCTNGVNNQQWLQTGFFSDPGSDNTYYVELYSGQCLTWTPATSEVSATP